MNRRATATFNSSIDENIIANYNVIVIAQNNNRGTRELSSTALCNEITLTGEGLGALDLKK